MRSSQHRSRGYALLEVSSAVALTALALLPILSAISSLLVRLASMERRQELEERLSAVRTGLEFRFDQVASADGMTTAQRGDLAGSGWRTLPGRPSERFDASPFQYQLRWIEGTECDWILLVGRADDVRATLARAWPKP